MSLLNDLLRLNQSQRGPILNQSQRGPMRMSTLSPSTAEGDGDLPDAIRRESDEIAYQEFIGGMGAPGRSPMRRFFKNKFNDLFQEYQAKILDEQGRLPTTPEDPFPAPPKPKPGSKNYLEELYKWSLKWGKKPPPQEDLSFTNFLKGLNAENRFGSMAPGLRGQYSSQYAPRTRFLTF